MRRCKAAHQGGDEAGKGRRCYCPSRVEGGERRQPLLDSRWRRALGRRGATQGVVVSWRLGPVEGLECSLSLSGALAWHARTPRTAACRVGTCLGFSLGWASQVRELGPKTKSCMSVPNEKTSRRKRKKGRTERVSEIEQTVRKHEPKKKKGRLIRHDETSYTM